MVGAAGFEPATSSPPCHSCLDANGPNTGLTTGPAAACTNACTGDPENRPEAPPDPSAPDCARLVVIADLLADLSPAHRREVIAELAPADRAAIARLLIEQGGSKGERLERR